MGLIWRGVGLHGRYFRALGAKVVSPAICFFADVPKLTVGAAADTTVEVAADDSLLEWLGRCRLGWEWLVGV